MAVISAILEIIAKIFSITDTVLTNKNTELEKQRALQQQDIDVANKAEDSIAQKKVKDVQNLLSE